MKQFTFDVPCEASLKVEAETEDEARAEVAEYLDANDNTVEIDLADGYVFYMGVNSESEPELIDEEEIE